MEAEFFGYAGHDGVPGVDFQGKVLKGPCYLFNGRLLSGETCSQLGLAYKPPEDQLVRPQWRCIKNTGNVALFYETPFSHPYWEQYYEWTPSSECMKAVGQHVTAFEVGKTYSSEAIQDFSDKCYASSY